VKRDSFCNLPFMGRLRVVLLSSLATCSATLTGCSSTQAVDDYVREHNILGERVCNAQADDVSSDDILARGCPADLAKLDITGNTQNEEKDSNLQEEAL